MQGVGSVQFESLIVREIVTTHKRKTCIVVFKRSKTHMNSGGHSFQKRNITTEQWKHSPSRWNSWPRESSQYPCHSRKPVPRPLHLRRKAMFICMMSFGWILPQSDIFFVFVFSSASKVSDIGLDCPWWYRILGGHLRTLFERVRHKKTDNNTREAS